MEGDRATLETRNNCILLPTARGEEQLRKEWLDLFRGELVEIASQDSGEYVDGEFSFTAFPQVTVEFDGEQVTVRYEGPLSLTGEIRGPSPE